MPNIFDIIIQENKNEETRKAIQAIAEKDPEFKNVLEARAVPREELETVSADLTDTRSKLDKWLDWKKNGFENWRQAAEVENPKLKQDLSEREASIADLNARLEAAKAAQGEEGEVDYEKLTDSFMKKAQAMGFVTKQEAEQIAAAKAEEVRLQTRREVFDQGLPAYNRMQVLSQRASKELGIDLPVEKIGAELDRIGKNPSDLFSLAYDNLTREAYMAKNKADREAEIARVREEGRTEGSIQHATPEDTGGYQGDLGALQAAGANFREEGKVVDLPPDYEPRTGGGITPLGIKLGKEYREMAAKGQASL